jgi:hypothetical protein
MRYISVVQITNIFGGRRNVEKGKYRWRWMAELMAKLGAMYYDYFIIPKNTYVDAPEYGSAIGINYGTVEVDK